MDANSLIESFETWGNDRKIIKHSTPKNQFLKTIEEVGELASALAKDNNEAMVDAIGDIVVTLTLVSACAGVSIVDCMAAAWEQIKDRKGHLTPGGVFVKEENALDATVVAPLNKPETIIVPWGMVEYHHPRIEVICNTCRGIAGLAPTCPDCMGKGWIWKINSPAEPWKYRDEDPACFRPGFDRDDYERKVAATRAASDAQSGAREQGN